MDSSGRLLTACSSRSAITRHRGARRDSVAGGRHPVGDTHVADMILTRPALRWPESRATNGTRAPQSSVIARRCPAYAPTQEQTMDDVNAPKSEIPTLAEWAGGSAVFEAL